MLESLILIDERSTVLSGIASLLGSIVSRVHIGYAHVGQVVETESPQAASVLEALMLLSRPKFDVSRSSLQLPPAK